MNLPLDPYLAFAWLRADELHRQATDARLVAAARPRRTGRPRLIAGAAVLRAGAARLRPQLTARRVTGPSGCALQTCC